MARAQTSGNPLDLQKVAAIGEKLRQLRRELSLIFPERLHLIEQIIYALLTREHVLIFGPYGTGKSDLTSTLFSVFEGATMFPIGLTKFMSEANLIGIPNPKKMRDEGVLEYLREGGILDADFAELDELFDSNPPLLRVLLGILNERQFKRGRQCEKAKLHTAVASTNGNPQDEAKKHPELGAVIDRFLFQSMVRYLQNPESRRRMFEKYLCGEKPTVRIPLADLKYISGIVTDANQIADPQLIEIYDRIIEAYAAQAKDQVISDRRKCKLLQLAEANALLFGRYDVLPEDFMAVRWGLCMGANDGQHEAFKATATPVIEDGMKNMQGAVDAAEIALVAELHAKIPDLPAECTGEELVTLRRKLTALAKDLGKIKPKLASTEDKKQKALSAVETRAKEVLDRIEKG